MRRIRPLLIVVVLVALARPAAAQVELPPWRGALARRAFAEAALGRVPMPSCDRVIDSTGITARRLPPAWFGWRPAEGHLSCTGMSADSLYRFAIEIDDGWAYAMQQTWFRPVGTGRAFADSVARALEAERGAPIRCQARYPVDDRMEVPSRWLHFRGPEGAPYVVELQLYESTWIGGPRGRHALVTLQHHNGTSACRPE